MKYIISIACVTLLALLYVHQQVELVKLSYAIEYKEKSLEDILDRKQNLEYNVNNLEAPSRLEKVLISRRIDIAFPKRSQVVGRASVSPNARNASLAAAGVERKVNRFGIFEFFGLRAEAQAKEK